MVKIARGTTAQADWTYTQCAGAIDEPGNLFSFGMPIELIPIGFGNYWAISGPNNLWIPVQDSPVGWNVTPEGIITVPSNAAIGSYLAGFAEENFCLRTSSLGRIRYYRFSKLLRVRSFLHAGQGHGCLHGLNRDEPRQLDSQLLGNRHHRRRYSSAQLLHLELSYRSLRHVLSSQYRHCCFQARQNRHGCRCALSLAVSHPGHSLNRRFTALRGPG